MSRYRIVILLVLSLLVVISLTAEAVADITSLTVPTSAIVNTQVTMIVQGTGTCGHLKIEFGDGASIIQGGTLPITTHHIYTAEGSKTVTATSNWPTCSGQVSATLTVKPVPRYKLPKLYPKPKIGPPPVEQPPLPPAITK